MQRSSRTKWLCLILANCLAISSSNCFAQTQVRGARTGTRNTATRPAPNQTRQSVPAAKPAQQLSPQATNKQVTGQQLTAVSPDASGKFTLRHRLKAGEII